MKNVGIRIVLEEELEKKFRKVAMEKYGYKKGALSKFANEIIRKYLEEEGSVSEKTLSFRNFLGVLKLKESSVEYVKRIRKEAEKRLEKMGL